MTLAARDYDQSFGVGDFRVGGWEGGVPVCPGGCVAPAGGAPLAALMLRAAPYVFRAAQAAPRLMALMGSARLTHVKSRTLHFVTEGGFYRANRSFDYVFGKLGTIRPTTTPNVRAVEFGNGMFSASVRPFAKTFHAPTIQMNLPGFKIEIRFVEALPLQGV